MSSAAFLGAVVFAASAGLTTFVAPCAFPLLPGYVGFYLHQEDRPPAVVSGLTAAGGAVLALAGFGAFGAVYAIAAAGCVVPLFLGVVAQASSLPPTRGAVVLGTYAATVAAPLLGVTLLSDTGVTVWRSVGGYAGRLKQAAGVLLVVAGVGQLYLSIAVLDVL